MIRSKEANAYKKAVSDLCIANDVDKLEGKVYLNIIFHPKTKKDGTESSVRIDLDNCLKVAIDALNGFAYTDDKQIVKIVAEIGKAIENGGLTVSWTEYE